MKRHDLKCWPAYFAAIRAGDKTFELRRNDRGFEVGDIIRLLEFDPATCEYTGQEEERQITYLLSEEIFGFVHGYVAIGFGRAPSAGPVMPAGGVTIDALRDWHQHNASEAVRRVAEYRRSAAFYAREAETQPALRASAHRMDSLAEAAEAEARFHGAAAAIVRAA